MNKKKQVVELYQDSTLSIDDIVELTGVTASVVCRTAKQAGLPLRRPKQLQSVIKSRRCKSCGRLIKIQDAAFCPYCGKDIQTLRDKAFKSLDNIKELLGRYFETDEETGEFVYPVIEASDDFKTIYQYICNSKEC